MSDDKREEQRRLAELEAEVSRLRERLGEQQPQAAAAAAAVEAGGAGADGSEQLVGKISRAKVITLAIVVALVAIGAFIAIFLTLSSGFDSLAKKAARSLVPEAPAPAREGSGTGSSNPPRPSGPTAPGL